MGPDITKQPDGTLRVCLTESGITACCDVSSSGFTRSKEDVCLWTLERPQWTAQLLLQSDGLVISWSQEGTSTERAFSYGLSRADVEAAILAGP